MLARMHANAHIHTSKHNMHFKLASTYELSGPKYVSNPPQECLLPYPGHKLAGIAGCHPHQAAVYHMYVSYMNVYMYICVCVKFLCDMYECVVYHM